MRDIDLHVGDFVQVRPHAHAHAGEIGRVIRITVAEKYNDLAITVMFSTTESERYTPYQLVLLRSVKPSNGKQEVRYEKR